MKPNYIKDGHLYIVTSEIHGHEFEIGSIVESLEDENKDSGSKCIILDDDGATVNYWWLRSTEVFEIGKI